MNKILRKIKLFLIACICIITLYIVNSLIFSDHIRGGPKIMGNTYEVYPGILPDSTLYKLKIIRNRIIEKIIIGKVKKVEFDLLMANKTIHASKLLFDKGEISLAKETVLKGEDYYSKLVQDYNSALLAHEKISPALNNQITKAALKHQEIFFSMKKKLSKNDQKEIDAALTFSKINYDFIQKLKESKN